MRTKVLLKYNFSTARFGIFCFGFFYMIGTLLGGILSTVAGGTVGMSVEVGNGVTKSWSTSIIAFIIFMLISSLIGSQKDTQFLITRSASRKEIFLSSAIFLIPLAAIMSALQMISIYVDSFVRYFFGADFRGLNLDFQVMQAPNMKNPFVFFMVSFSILLGMGAKGYLLGSLLARWKVLTIGMLTVLAIAFIGLIAFPGFLETILEVGEYLFTDNKNGLVIVIKQIILAVLSMFIAFPIMRRITAAKK